MPLSAIALGSNLGDRERTLLAAAAQIRGLGLVTAVSTFHDTAPAGMIDQPRFLNGALLLETALAPQALLQALLAIELTHGRDRASVLAKGPRTLDLDLLFYSGLILDSPALTLPHPALHQRRFVLAPLAEIAPAWLHPRLQRTVAELLAALD